MNRFLNITLFVLLLYKPQDLQAEQLPNFVIIFCDDLGYGDLGCFGHPTIRTPSLDRMAAEGQKWTNFYAPAPVCTPSRAGLLTGRLPIRNGMTSAKRVVLFPNSGGGLPQSEITIAEVLKTKGYATSCIGKWHLGHLPQFLPMQQGFDEYYGIPYSNDMHRPGGVPLMRGEEIIERPARQATVTKRYTEEALRFIRQQKDNPFFLYMPHTMPHIPLFASEKFKGKSPRGLYGDVVEEIDWSVGQILEALRELDIDKRTLVVFTSDNGPWLSFKQNGGSAGLLRAGKGTTFEGGMREPTIFWWPGRLKGGRTVSAMGSALDLLATCAALAGAQIPDDRKLDSVDLTPVMDGKQNSVRDTMFFYTRGVLHGVRKGKWKMHLLTRDPIRYGRPPQKHDPPLLYNLDFDPSEQFNIANKNKQVISDLMKLVEEHKSTLKPVEDQLAIPQPKKE
ncbi:MAG: sulfatase [Planctomycetota bacterium]|jgi:arylsulfatase A-like enzyme|nr:sulfatase [Planctomycetota bacterium]MDP7133410.1 sulfatase [Planctomycetota bacterium]MDP7252151.1 sulfatase [Planctomycetota bacterium]